MIVPGLTEKAAGHVVSLSPISRGATDYAPVPDAKLDLPIPHCPVPIFDGGALMPRWNRIGLSEVNDGDAAESPELQQSPLQSGSDRSGGTS
jgi:hypothetical protein